MPRSSRATLTLEPDGRLCVDSDYVEAFVAALKAEIPFRRRTWEHTRRRWLVSAMYADVVVDLLYEWYDEVFDRRSPSEPQASTLPAAIQHAFRTLYLREDAPPFVVEGIYRLLSKSCHPDHGGSHEAMVALNAAMATLRTYLTKGEPSCPR